MDSSEDPFGSPGPADVPVFGSPTVTAAETEGHGRSRRKRIRAFAICGVVLWSGGLLAIGIVIGFGAHQPVATPPPDVVISVAEPLAKDLQPSSLAATVMPGVVGLTEADARAVLADAGLDDSKISLAEVPRAGAAGVVALQDPAAGTTSPTKITLSISAPAAMPDLSGATRDRAQAIIQDLGARPVFNRVYQPGVPPDTVISTSPTKGNTMSELVTVTLAARPASVFLTDLRSISSNCKYGSEKADGVESQHAVSCRLYGPDSNPYQLAWDLSRKAARFTAQVGISDTSAIDAVGLLEVLVDGVVVASYDVSFGTLTDIDLPVVNALRLELRVSTAATPDYRSYLVLLDAALQGADADITSLAGRT